MSKLSTKFVMTLVAAGILIGAVTTVSAGNLAQAQIRVPFLPQQPQVQAPTTLLEMVKTEEVYKTV